jgi:hypothetical protein
LLFFPTAQVYIVSALFTIVDQTAITIELVVTTVDSEVPFKLLKFSTAGPGRGTVAYETCKFKQNYE